MGAPTVPLDVFQHDELPDSETYFRLLRITSAVREEPTEDAESTNSIIAECEMISLPVANAPPYRAVSYTWGDPEKTRMIRVNGRPMQVRWNCAYMLWQAYRHSGADHHIWVDAICINQVVTEEKNHQVAQMGKIFAAAERVLACIGSHDVSSSFLFRILARHSTLFTIASSYTDQSSYMVQSSISMVMSLYGWRYRSSKTGELLGEFIKVVSRPYFRRVWTWPELWLARSVDILCGRDCTSGKSLHGLRSILQYKLARRSAGLWDSRDRIYALIPAVKWGFLGGKPVQPDYNTDLFDLALNTLRRFDNVNFTDIYAMIGCLGLHLTTSPKTAQAIHDRCHASQVNSETCMATEDVLPIGRRKEFFFGFQLSLVDNIWQIDIPGYPDYRESVYENHILTNLPQSYPRVTNNLNQKIAVLPPCVEPGDWMASREGFGTIILRERGDGRYKIIGESWGIKPLFTTIGWQGPTFKVFFELGDALAIALNHPHIRKRRRLDYDRALYLACRSLENGVCYAEGSSYAEIHSES
ncbi:hypothetical protein F4803DRAFT_575755 [Xylaria telfairii]|nr:hypothetical protein F4803DRAFT_575755 [Xylaria telfairii]